MVQILLEHGADPHAKMVWTDNYPAFETGVAKQYKSAFEILLKRNPGAAELILNQGIKKYNDLDSPELVLVFDFELFLQECSAGCVDKSGLNGLNYYFKSFQVKNTHSCCVFQQLISNIVCCRSFIPKYNWKWMFSMKFIKIVEVLFRWGYLWSQIKKNLWMRW